LDIFFAYCVPPLPLPCQRHPQSKIQFYFFFNEKSTPATATFVALPRRRQPSSAIADSSYPVPKTLPSTFVAVVAAMAWGMAVARAVAVAVAVLVAVALARAVAVTLSVVVAVVIAVGQWWR
jgi:hypothetical protein